MSGQTGVNPGAEMLRSMLTEMKKEKNIEKHECAKEHYFNAQLPSH